MTTIAIIPARKGSKRLPRKNILAIEPGVSLVQHAIDCAVDSGMIDHTYVLSDDSRMLYERAIPFDEPHEDASDSADISTAVSHAVERIERSIGRIHYVVTLQPAVLARSPLIVRRVVEAVIEQKARGAVTAARTVPWRWVIRGVNAGNYWSPGPYPRSQGAPVFLDEINAVQVADFQSALEGKRWGLPLLLAELPHWAAALDVDDPDDLARARDMWPWARLRLETWEPTIHRAETVNGDD